MSKARFAGIILSSYLEIGSRVQAAIFAASFANVVGSRLLANVDIAAAIQAGQRAHLEAAGVRKSAAVAGARARRAGAGQ